MSKKNTGKKLLSSIFLFVLSFVFLIQAIAATALFLRPATAQADSTFTFEVPILHGQEQTITLDAKSGTKPIADYIKSIYTFAVGAVGIVAAVVLMIGGVVWITAGGNASNVSEAKSMITASLTGMVLVLCSYLILGQINPALVNLQADVIAPVTPIVTPNGTTDTATAINNLLGTQCSWQTPQSTDNIKCSEWLGSGWTNGTNCSGTRQTTPQVPIPQMCCCPPSASTVASSQNSNCSWQPSNSVLPCPTGYSGTTNSLQCSGPQPDGDACCCFSVVQ